MKFHSIETLFITNPTNIRYITGFVGVGRERESYLLLAKDIVYLFTNSLYLEQARRLTRDLRIIEISRENPIAGELKRILRRLNPAKQGSTLMKIGFEEADLTVAEYNKLKQELKGVTLVPTKNRIEKRRMIKREDEIENIRAAAKLTDQCFTFILSKLTPGVEEGEIAWEIESFFRECGATLAFSPIVGFGENTSQPHYLSSAVPQRLNPAMQGSTLMKTDIVLLDFGARVNGYCSDMTRVVFVGKPKDEWKRAYQTVLEAQQAALEYLRAQGRALNSQLSGSTTDKIARQVIKKAGFPPYPHSLGHAVGLDIHEPPRLSVKKDETLKPGMVITVEPGVYVEGSFGIRIEDLVLITDNGITILSKSSKSMTIL